MKNFLYTRFLLALMALSAGAFGQTTYNVSTDATITSAGIPTQCSNCTINIANGVTLTIDKQIYLQNTTFNGGNIVANHLITFWSNGGFNNTSVTFNNGSGITSSGVKTINNSTFTFLGTAKATFWSTVNMTASVMRFLGNSNMESTAAFNMISNSVIVVGDGTAASNAFVFFNGGTLNEYDSSYVTLGGYNNYYRNWASYNSIVNNRSYNTAFNSYNCGTPGRNACQAPNVYGPATLNFGGVSTTAVLPVKLSSFTAKLNGLQVELSWITEAEKNSGRFEVERSIDGKNWTKIGSVASNGNTSLTSRYQYTDVIKINGTISYRLKMVDRDDTFEYSPIRIIKSDAGVEMSVFPNPAASYITVASGDNNVKNIQLVTMSGQVVKQVSGAGNVYLAVSEFSAGNYIIRVVDNTGSVKIFKIIIKK